MVRCLTRVGVQDEEELIGCFSVRPVVSAEMGLEAMVATKSLQLKHYRLDPEAAVVRSWKGHTMPVTSMSYDPMGTVVACGCSDGRIFVYDVAQGHATHALRGHAGPVLSVRFHPEVRRVTLVSCSQDSTLRCWDLRTSESKLLKGHMGAVADCCVVGGNTLVSVGRDRVLIQWDMKKGTSVATTPLYDELSSVARLSAAPECAWHDEIAAACGGVLAPEAGVVLVGGNDGVLKVFHLEARKVVLERRDTLQFAIEQVLVPEDGRQPVTVVTRDQNLLRYDAATLTRRQQVVGDLDEIVDAKIFGGNSDRIAVATNSKDVKVWHVMNNDWELLGGHTNTVLSLDVSCSHRTLCSGGKDSVLRLWNVSVQPAAALGALEGHTDSINAVAWGGDSFVVSGGKDRTIKVWKLRPDHAGGAVQVYTCIGHAAEINCLDVSPNEQVIASGGVDKRIVLWNVGKPLGAAPIMGRKLLGHKRGIWDVRFSPVDRRLASCSGDRTVRIWNAGSGECLRVLEGHLAATLKVRWMSTATQLVSAGSDGLLKVWDVRDGSTVATVGEDQHSGGDKIWALDVARDGELVVSGGSDGTLCLWRDATKESTIASLQQKQREAEQKQQLDNLVMKGSLAEALALALALDHRARSKQIVDQLRRSHADPREALVTVVRSQLSEESLELLIKLCCEWNKNSHHAMTAQAVMEAVLLAVPADQLVKSGALRSALEGWLAFSQRHLQRITHLASAGFVIDHALELMGGGPLSAHASSATPFLVDDAGNGTLTTSKRSRE